MKRWSRQSWMVVVGLVVLGSSLMAQAKPNFSGRWVQVSPERGAGREDIVTHDATTLTIERASQKEPPMTFKLDGTEGRTVVSMQGTEFVTLSKGEWVGTTLVLESKISVPDGSTITARHQLTIDAEGRLVVNTSSSMPGMPPRDEKIIYTKK